MSAYAQVGGQPNTAAMLVCCQRARTNSNYKRLQLSKPIFVCVANQPRVTINHGGRLVPG